MLRFWETKFSFIRPMKRAGGRRFYRPQDLAVLKGVRVLLHDDGYTIKGVQRLHKELGVKRLLAAGQGETGDAADFPTPDVAPDDDVLELSADSVLTSQLDPESEHRLREALGALEAAKARLARALMGG